MLCTRFPWTPSVLTLKNLRHYVENQFSGKTYFYTLASSSEVLWSFAPPTRTLPRPDFDVRAGHDRLRLRITQPGCEAGAAVDHWRITRCTHEPKRAKQLFASNRDEEEEEEEEEGSGKKRKIQISGLRETHPLVPVRYACKCLITNGCVRNTSSKEQNVFEQSC